MLYNKNIQVPYKFLLWKKKIRIMYTQKSKWNKFSYYEILKQNRNLLFSFIGC